MKVNYRFLLNAIVVTSALISFGSAHAEDKLNYDEASTIDIRSYKGQTFLNFMEQVVKPALDQKAVDGYQVGTGDVVTAAMDSVSGKVRFKVLKAINRNINVNNKSQVAVALTQLGQIADEVAAMGDVTMYTLPEILMNDISLNVSSPWNLSTFIGLASGGGIAVKFNEDNIAYNIHYGTGDVKKDAQSGRSYGYTEGVRFAEDASDAAYLEDLEKYVKDPSENIDAFYQTIVDVLLNCDVTGYANISNFGAAVLTDFIAVYIAEQDRNLMDFDLSTQQWDVSLLEATLLSSFHGGQDEVWLMFEEPPKWTDITRMKEELAAKELDPTLRVEIYAGPIRFTNMPYDQEEGGVERSFERQATLVDYWQFSFHPGEHKSRSGINLTRPEFRSLGDAITQWERDHNPEIIAKVESFFPTWNRGGNLYKEFSVFTVNYDTDRDLSAISTDLGGAMSSFLVQVKKDAKEITKWIKESQEQNGGTVENLFQPF